MAPLPAPSPLDTLLAPEIAPGWTCIHFSLLKKCTETETDRKTQRQRDQERQTETDATLACPGPPMSSAAPWRGAVGPTGNLGVPGRRLKYLRTLEAVACWHRGDPAVPLPPASLCGPSLALGSRVVTSRRFHGNRSRAGPRRVAALRLGSRAARPGQGLEIPPRSDASRARARAGRWTLGCEELCPAGEPLH